MDAIIFAKVKELLIPFVRRENHREAIIKEAFGGYPQLLNQIVFEGNASDFSTRLISLLNDFGELPNGQMSLHQLLQVLRKKYGPGTQRTIDQICTESLIENPVTEIANQSSNEFRTIRILFFAANTLDAPSNDLGQEFREIENVLQRSPNSAQIELVSVWATSTDDLQIRLLGFKPHIVHFSSHGSPEGEILLRDTNGRSTPVQSSALRDVFRDLSIPVQCVVLNACFSENTGNEIALHVGSVIGTSRAIEDTAAIQFSAGFYTGVSFGQSIQRCFNLGCTRVNLNNLYDNNLLKLLPTDRDHSNFGVGD